MTVAAIAPRRWTKPPFIKRPWLRWTLGLGAAAYLALALGTTEVNWARVWAGLPRGLQFLSAFFPPDFTSRWSEIVDGISESLWMTVVALVIPAVFDLAVFGRLEQHGARIEQLSFATCLVLVILYAFGLLFTFGGVAPKPAVEEGERPRESAKRAVIELVVATVLVGLLSEILVGEIEAAKRLLHMSDLFMGVIFIAIIGNAAEHATAIIMAKRDKMELALSIAIGSSIQIALLVAPVLVFLSWIIGQPMSLVLLRRGSTG